MPSGTWTTNGGNGDILGCLFVVAILVAIPAYALKVCIEAI